MTACGAAGAAVWQLGLPFGQAKVVWGVVHALVGLVLVPFPKRFHDFFRFAWRFR
jgi:hypothetical protein